MMDNFSKNKINESNFLRSPETIKKQLEKRSKHVNARISFDLCPEIETALKEKGIISKFESNSKNCESMNTNEQIYTEVNEMFSNSFEKSKSLYEFEDLEAVCNKTLSEALSETQLNDILEPSGFWNNSIFDNHQSPKKNIYCNPPTIEEESDSTTNSFETACVSNNSSYFTATGKSIIDQKVNSISSDLDDSLIILSDSIDETFQSKTNDGSQQLEFNDTLEEIEFIMTKGKDYMQNVVEKVTFSNPKETDLDKENMCKSKLPTPTSTKFKGRPQETFKKPLSSISSHKKIDFNNIRSPIGEYIKKTTKSPLILSAKPNSVNKLPKQISFNSTDPVRRNPSTIGTKNLPKKAYFSSDNKKYTDDRPPVIVPGGPKIQNHLKSSRLMGVVKHEGKIQMVSNPKTVTIPETSFSNLSVASGDVSFYTLKK